MKERRGGMREKWAKKKREERGDEGEEGRRETIEGKDRGEER